MAHSKLDIVQSVVQGRAGMSLPDYLASRRNAGASVRDMTDEVNRWILDADLGETVSRMSLYRYIRQTTRNVAIAREAA